MGVRVGDLPETDVRNIAAPSIYARSVSPRRSGRVGIMDTSLQIGGGIPYGRRCADGESGGEVQVGDANIPTARRGLDLPSRGRIRWRDSESCTNSGRPPTWGAMAGLRRIGTLGLAPVIHLRISRPAPPILTIRDRYRPRRLCAIGDGGRGDWRSRCGAMRWS